MLFTGSDLFYLNFIYSVHLHIPPFFRKTGGIGFSKFVGFVSHYDGDAMVIRALLYNGEFGHIFTNAYNHINYNSECKRYRALCTYQKLFQKYVCL